MKIESKAELNMISRSIREQWDIPRQKVIEALMEVIENRDPKLMIPAAEVLRKMDDANIKREILAEQKRYNEDQRRIQLLELARRIEPGELAKLASNHRG